MKLDEEWFDTSGCSLTRFTFDSEKKQLIINELKKYIVEEFYLEEAFHTIEDSVDSLLENKAMNPDNIKETKIKLTKVINGLTKAIDALNSLDSLNKEHFAFANYMITKNIFGVDSPEKAKSNPTKELYSCLEAAKCRLEVITSAEYKHYGAPRSLTHHIVTWWIRYTNTCQDPQQAKFVWRENKQKNSPYISLWNITKIAMECSGHHISDPSRYITEAIQRFNIIEGNC